VYSDLYIAVLSINDPTRSMRDLYSAREGQTRKRVATRLKLLAAILTFLGTAFSNDRFIFGASNLFGRQNDATFEEP
jgi:hypothetical protein